MVKLAAVLLWAGCFTLTVADGDFDLADALDTATKKPFPATKKPPAGGGHKPNIYPDLRPYSDDHGNEDSHWNPQPNPRPRPPPHPPQPQPGSYGNSGDFNDFDLNDGKPVPPRQAGDREHISDYNENTVDSSTTAQITSPVVAVVVLLGVGTLAGYNAYKQKKFCFKPRGESAIV